MDPHDITEINNVIALYGHVVDSRDWNRMSEIGTEDFVFDVSTLGLRPERARGIPEVTEFFRTADHPPVHHCTNAHVYDDDGEVRSRSKWLCVNPSGSVYGGDYDDFWTKTDVGWRIRIRAVTFRFGRKEPSRGR
jgi:hypothetical protein